MSKVTFKADQIVITELKSDISYKIQLYTGEYQQMEVAKLMMLPKGKVYQVTVEVDE